MKRAKSSSRDLSKAVWAKRRRVAVVWEQRVLTLAPLLLLPALLTLGHTLVVSRASVRVAATYASGASGTSSSAASSNLPPPLPRCLAKASEQGWGLLDELQQLRYSRAVLQARRDAVLMDQLPLVSASGSASGGTNHTFLYVGVLSEAPNRELRDAARAAWLQQTSRTRGVVAQFLVFGAANSTVEAAVQQEADELGDIMLIDAQPANSTMARHTYSLLEHALRQHSPLFILKAEDSTFVNVPALVDELRAYCRNPGCLKERLYFGREMNSTRSQQQVDAAYAAHTSLKAYMPYMLGGGYVLSADLAQVILETNQQQEDGFLKFMPSEDISIGVWLMSLDLRRIDHPQVVSLDGCAGDQQQRAGTAAASCSIDICSPWRPPLMLQHVPSTEAMYHIGTQVQQCGQQQALLSTARQLAIQRLAASARPGQPEGAVLHLSPPDAQLQYLLGGYAGRMWSPDGQQLLALRVPNGAAQPGFKRIEVGVFRRQPGGGWHWEQLNSAAAWNTRRGPMLQWLGPTSRYIVFNDRGCNSSSSSSWGASGSFAAWMLPWEQVQEGSSSGGSSSSGTGLCAVIYDLQQMTRSRSLPTALYAVSPDGRLAATVSFERLDAAAPGSGYPAAAAVGSDKAEGAVVGEQATTSMGLAANDGLWLWGVASGQQRLLVSLQQMFDAARGAAGSTLPASAASNCSHWVDAPQFNPSSTSMAFTYHVGHCQDGQQPHLHLFVADIRTAAMAAAGPAAGSVGKPQQRQQQQQSMPQLVPLEGASLRPPCFAFMPNGNLFVGSTAGFYEVHPPSLHQRQLSPPSSLVGSEPISCAMGGPNGWHALVSRRSGTGRRRRLVVWDLLAGWNSVVGEYSASAAGRTGFSHVGLQPIWSPDGTAAVFDSSHNGQGWQLYEAALPLQELHSGSGGGGAIAADTGGQVLGADKDKDKDSLVLQQVDVAEGGALPPRHVYIDLGSHQGASVLRYLESRGRQQRMQVHAWEPDPRHLPQLRKALERHTHQHSITVYEQATWTADGSVPFYPDAISLQRGGHGAQPARPSTAPSLWQRMQQLVLGRQHDPRFGSMFLASGSSGQAAAGRAAVLGTLSADGSSSSSSGGGDRGSGGNSSTQVQAADFGAWLLKHVRRQDHVSIHMDIAGAEFDVLPALIRDGSIALIDELHVEWSTAVRPEFGGWPESYAYIFNTLGIRDLKTMEP